ncbi:hypothetical protein ACQBAU_18550 [Propionibacteriaceae bacterium Y2011]
MGTYDVSVTREGRWWMVEIPQHDLLTQARRLADVEGEARSVLSVTLDVPPSTIELDIHIHVGGDDLADVRRDIEALKSRAAEAEAQVSTLMRDVAVRMAADEIPVRDIGEVLGVSHQRAHQLVSH